MAAWKGVPIPGVMILLKDFKESHWFFADPANFGRSMEPQDFTVLYVDDEPHNLTTFRAAFRRQFQIETALGGQQGLEVLATKPIHLVISDQRMPEMTGVQFLEKVAARYPEVIRVILTGFSDLEALIGAINRVGIFRYLTKPWHEPDLLLTMENARQMAVLQSKNKQLISELQARAEQQAHTLELFRKFVPPSVVDQTLSASDNALLEGQLRQMAILFCDVRGFTSISEQLAPREVVRFLNRFYSLTSAIIKKYHGLVVQFIGDEVFAIFGAPESSGDDLFHSVCAALEMKNAIAQLSQEFAAVFGRDVYVGIGLNFGEAVAGNMGSFDRINYSVIGEAVNLAKQLESLTKESPNSILVQESFFEKIKDRVEAKDWGVYDVKGKKEDVHVYEILSLKP